jgi:hypothetical protein
MLQGSLNEHGFFTPDQGQPALDIFEGLVGMKWKQFRDKVLNDNEGTIKLGRKNWNEEVLAPGLAILHTTTADALISMARQDLDTNAAARAAAAITIDAKRRVKLGDHKFWTVSEMGTPHGDVYVTLAGEQIPVPNVSMALADMEPKLLSAFAKNEMHKHHNGAEETDGSRLVAIYEALADLQKLGYGMRMMNRYLQPSPHSRADNLVIVTNFNLKVVQDGMAGFSERSGFEPDSERFDAQLENIAASLRSTLDIVEAEMAKRNSFKI